jgi:multiple sugar transport system permease protein
VTLPMMRNIIAITVLVLPDRHLRRGPLRTTQVFATYAFTVGILSGDMPLGVIVVVTKPQADFPDSAIPVARC